MKGPLTRTALRELRRWLPAWWPVEVRFVDEVVHEGKRIKGLAWLIADGDTVTKARIAIDRHLPDTYMWEVLAHEWAHIIAWQPEESAIEEDEHPDAWGVAYARCYRTAYCGSRGA